MQAARGSFTKYNLSNNNNNNNNTSWKSLNIQLNILMRQDRLPITQVWAAWEKQLVIPCDYLIFPGNTEQVQTGNMCLVMQMYGPMITKHAMQTPLLRAKKKEKKKHAIKGTTCVCVGSAFGIKVHITRIYRILIEQSHQTRLSRWKWWLHESLCDSVCEAYH